MVAGMCVVLFGTYLLGQMGPHTSPLDLGWRMAVLGIGLGPLQSLYGVAIQNAVPPNRIGVVTSANQFFRQIGSTVGVAMFGTLLTNELNGKLAVWATSMGLKSLNLSQLRSLSAQPRVHAGVMDIPDAVRVLICDSVTHVILLSIIVAVIALIATFMIPELPMRARTTIPTKDAVPADAHL
jgi:hypothetical protein